MLLQLEMRLDRKGGGKTAALQIKVCGAIAILTMRPYSKEPA
jgi:hypothetical protein